ncbi:hypothetical protein C8Q75DRAFT_225205 [Abortiporus biennis]|nr:hypothetical protein C8Q75DRAFT_225205 [Abortiporus biennis]
MSFEHASVTKALIVGLALTSITAGIFDVKHLLHLQLVPHISKYFQYWRILSHHFACANSSDLFLIELILYNAAVHIERAYGSVKFASFLVLATAINSIAEFLTLLLLYPIPLLRNGFNSIPAGPLALTFTILYQYSRLIPRAYQFKVFGVTMSDKIWVYALVFQLTLSQFPATLITALLGVFTGYLYRSDLLQLKGWRIPHRLVNLSETWIAPVLASGGRTVRRTNRVLPETRTASVSNEEDEVITTARLTTTGSSAATPRSRMSVSIDDIGSGSMNPTGGVVRQWVTELTDAARPSTGGEGTVRVPSDGEIQILTGMFPHLERSVILGALQRSPNIEAAAETLLSSQS